MSRDSEGQMAFRGLFRPAAVATGAALLAAALAGCGGGGEQPITTPAPKTTTTTTVPNTTTTSTPSTTQSSTTTIPTVGNAKGYNGAVSQVSLYFARYNQANLEGRIELLDGLFTPACEDCVALREKVAGRIAKGIKPNGDIFTAKDVGIETYHPNATPMTATVIAEVMANPVKLSDPSGKVVDTFVGGPQTLRFTLVFDKSWQITRAKKVV